MGSLSRSGWANNGCVVSPRLIQGGNIWASLVHILGSAQGARGKVAGPGRVDGNEGMQVAMRLKANLGFQTGGKVKVVKSTEWPSR